MGKDDKNRVPDVKVETVGSENSSGPKSLNESRDRKILDQWFEDAKKVKLETLHEFVRHLLKDYNHDYGTIVYAVTAAAVAAAWVVDADPKQGGITGFQAGVVNWKFLQHWGGMKTPMRLMKYGDLLYPQYADRFQKTIGPGIWKWVQEEAQKNIKADHGVKSVRRHWQSIVKGKVPFGFKVVDEHAEPSWFAKLIHRIRQWYCRTFLMPKSMNAKAMDGRNVGKE